jgi:GntR family transcriptional regulator/MocR family aminotransferase
VHRLNQAYRDRARALRQAIASHAPMLQPMAAQGGSALWVSGPRGLDTRALAQRLLPLGVLVEPGDVFYPGTQPPRHHLRIGYSSITPERIEPGVRLLGRELARLRTAPMARARAG